MTKKMEGSKLRQISAVVLMLVSINHTSYAQSNNSVTVNSNANNNYTSSVSFTTDTCNYTCFSPPLPPNCKQIKKFLTGEVNTVSISISYKSVCIIPENTFIKYHRLYHVTARNTKIYLIEHNAFQGTILYSIDLMNNLLTTFPNLSSVAETLVSLNLAYNRISEVDATMLQYLQRLKYLNLVDNDLKTFNCEDGQMHMSDLTHLYIHQNYELQLSENFTEFFMNLTLLSISGNCSQHKHYLPRFIKRVEFLYCNIEDYVATNEVSSFFKHLDQLTQIKIHSGQCVNILDDAPPNLLTLDVSSCDLGGNIDFLRAVRSYSKQMTHLILKHNLNMEKLSFGEFKCTGNEECGELLTGSGFIFNVHFTGMNTNINNPNGIICNCTKNGTVIENFNISKGQLQAVEHLDLTYNSISMVDSYVLSGMCSLLTLLMSHNDLSYLPPLFNSSYSSDCNWMKLESLDLSYNKLTLINESSFTGMYSLKTLLLRHNELHHLQQLTSVCSDGSNVTYFCNELKNLQYLDVSYNKLEIIDPKSFEGLYELTDLILNNNDLLAFPPIQSICPATPVGMTNSCKLKNVYLFQNNISEINSANLDGICLLEEILLSNNRLASFPEFNGSTCTIASVRKIDLSDNIMTTMDRNSLKGMIRLQDLRIGTTQNSCDNPDSETTIGNTIECIGNLSDVAGSLEYLYYSNHDPLSNISRSDCFNDELRKLKNLKQLFITGNGIKDFPDVEGSKKTLTFLSVTGTSILSCPDSFLSGLEQCTTFDICNNQLLRNISSISGNPVLKTLNLKGNKALNSLPDDISSVNRSLQMLDLSDTPISNMSQLTPASLPIVQDVRLRNMNIKQMPPYLSQVQTLMKIDVSNSEVTCSCDLAWLKPGLYTGQLVDTNTRCSIDSTFPSHPWKYFLQNVNDCNVKEELNKTVQDDHITTTVSVSTARNRIANFSLQFSNDNYDYSKSLTGQTFEAPYAALIGSFELIILLLELGIVVALDILTLNTKLTNKCFQKFNNNIEKPKNPEMTADQTPMVCTEM